MKVKTWVVAIAFFLLACAATPVKRSFGETVDDQVILVGLKTKYIKDKLIDADKISIKIFKGVVTLTGEFDTQEEIRKAIEIAEIHKGVLEVKSHLVLKKFGTLKEKKEGLFESFKTLFETERSQRQTPRIDLEEQDLLEEEKDDESNLSSPQP